MSTTIQEHDYTEKNLNLKETELRLGLPGSQSPPPSVKINNGFLKNPNNNVSGSKRGFADAIDGDNSNWVLTMSDKSEVGDSKNEVLLNKDGVFVVQSHKPVHDMKKKNEFPEKNIAPPAAKARVVGWPPIRSYRKNTMASNLAKSNDEDDDEKLGGSGFIYVKVSMDGAPYLRKVDLKTYNNYTEFSSSLEKMFRCFTIGQCGSHGDDLSDSRLMDLLHGSEYVLTYEDKDGDWMLVGDVPWGMFTHTCRRLRIMKGSEAIGLAPRAMEKCKNRN